jgi:cardiolipin synthase A/B
MDKKVSCRKKSKKYKAFIMPCRWFIFFITLLALGNGCATLPDVTTIVDETSATPSAPRILSSKGLLSQQKSQALMDRLKRSGGPSDLLERHTAVVESITESPLTKGNRITLLTDGQETYAAMFRAIRQARDHVNMESYIIEDDETGRKFADLLLNKRAEGVAVRLIYDSMGSIGTPDTFFKRLRDGGVEVVPFNPLNPLNSGEKWSLTHRDHRKILIADGKLAIIGGVNISKVYSSRPGRRKQGGNAPIHWRDTDIQIEGPAVAELQKIFLDTWLKQKGSAPCGGNLFPELKETGGALVRVIGSTPGESNRLPFVVYVSALAFAERSIHLTNSYFVPDDQIVAALSDAARRGVDVKIILPGTTDSKLALYAQRHGYGELLKSGVRIYEHKTSLLHAKTAVIDGIWSTVGSTNLDYLSLLHNDEVNAVILDKEFAGEMEQMFARDLANCRPISQEEWQKRGVLPAVRDWFVHLFIRLL